jgi:hypothetical protein
MMIIIFLNQTKIEHLSKFKMVAIIFVLIVLFHIFVEEAEAEIL